MKERKEDVERTKALEKHDSGHTLKDLESAPKRKEVETEADEKPKAVDSDKEEDNEEKPAPIVKSTAPIESLEKKI